MIRLNGEKMRQKLEKLLVSNGCGKGRVNGGNGNGNGGNGKRH